VRQTDRLEQGSGEVMTGNEIKKIRNSLGMSIDSFAKKLGVRPPVVKQTEKKGKKELTFEEDLKILRALVTRGPDLVINRLLEFQKNVQELNLCGENIKLLQRLLNYEIRSQDKSQNEDPEDKKPEGSDRRSAIGLET
jgi:DNA-binding transcriptional regulator YiaG